MKVLMGLMVMGRMLMFMGPMLPGVLMVMHVGIPGMIMFMGMLVQVLMFMQVLVLMIVRFLAMLMFVAVGVRMLMRMQMFMFVSAFHFGLLSLKSFWEYGVRAFPVCRAESKAGHLRQSIANTLPAPPGTEVWG
jgi:hypothetical protein